MCKTYFSSVFSFDESPGSFLLSGEEVGGNSYTLDERGFKKKKRSMQEEVAPGQNAVKL